MLMVGLDVVLDLVGQYYVCGKALKFVIDFGVRTFSIGFAEPYLSFPSDFRTLHVVPIHHHQNLTTVRS